MSDRLHVLEIAIVAVLILGASWAAFNAGINWERDHHFSICGHKDVGGDR